MLAGRLRGGETFRSVVSLLRYSGAGASPRDHQVRSRRPANPDRGKQQDSRAVAAVTLSGMALIVVARLIVLKPT